jgi:hypothetical protein
MQVKPCGAAILLYLIPVQYSTCISTLVSGVSREDQGSLVVFGQVSAVF